MREKHFSLLLPNVSFQALSDVLLDSDFQYTYLTTYPLKGPNFEVEVGEWQEDEGEQGHGAPKRLVRQCTLSSPLDFAPQVLLKLIKAKAACSTLTQVAILGPDYIELNSVVSTHGVPLAQYCQIAYDVKATHTEAGGCEVRGTMRSEANYWPLKWVLESTLEGEQLSGNRDWQLHLQSRLAADCQLGGQLGGPTVLLHMAQGSPQPIADHQGLPGAGVSGAGVSGSGVSGAGSAIATLVVANPAVNPRGRGWYALGGLVCVGAAGASECSFWCTVQVALIYTVLLYGEPLLGYAASSASAAASSAQGAAQYVRRCCGRRESSAPMCMASARGRPEGGTRAGRGILEGIDLYFLEDPRISRSSVTQGAAPRSPSTDGIACIH